MVQLVVGRIGRAHGVRGDVLVAVRTDEPDERFAVGAVLATDPTDAGPLTVASARWHSGRLVVGFAGHGDRSAAEALAGVRLVVDSADLPPLEDPDEFHDHELVGLAVVTPAGESLGTVTDVVHGPAGDLLVVARPVRVDGLAGSAGGLPTGSLAADPGGNTHDLSGAPAADAELLVPFVREIVPTVDLNGRRVVVDPPPGLLEL
jgi:16S rRNA processing protein RimM